MCTGPNSCIKRRNSIQCKMCLVEERVTQALETLRTFGWSFHKKTEGSSRWAERLGGAHSTNKGGSRIGPDSQGLQRQVMPAAPGWRCGLSLAVVLSRRHVGRPTIRGGQMKPENISGTREMGLCLWTSLDHHLLSTARCCKFQARISFPGLQATPLTCGDLSHRWRDMMVAARGTRRERELEQDACEALTCAGTSLPSVTGPPSKCSRPTPPPKRAVDQLST